MVSQSCSRNRMLWLQQITPSGSTRRRGGFPDASPSHQDPTLLQRLLNTRPPTIAARSASALVINNTSSMMLHRQSAIGTKHQLEARDRSSTHAFYTLYSYSAAPSSTLSTSRDYLKAVISM
ncbi:hypothetical protein E4T50_10411 [Aureobasidium sp. EXF-12298]|nr:hypothetical protein E4T50_10411 [Aureobasidium sp. EXF-12298]